MTLLVLLPRQGNKFSSPNGIPSQSERELTALKATAIDAGKFPILAAHWRGPLTINGRLACNYDSPLTRRFSTAPVAQVTGPGR